MSCSSHSGSRSRRGRKGREGAAPSRVGRTPGEGPTQQPLSPAQRAQLQHGPESLGEDPKASWPGRENWQSHLKMGKTRDKLLLGEAGWKGLLQAGKGKVGPERHSLCSLTLLSPPLPCPLVSVPVFIELWDTRAVPQPRSSRKGGCVQP